MGRDKRLIEWRGKPLIEHAASSLYDGGITEIVIVLEPNSPCVGLPGLEKYTLITNPNPERGMLSSVICGLEAITNAPAAAILPGDHPFVPSAAVDQLLAYFLKHNPQLLAPRFAGKRGHPLFLDQTLFDEAKRCDPAVGLRQLVHRHEEDLHLLDLPYDKADVDLDHPSDLTKLEE